MSRSIALRERVASERTVTVLTGISVAMPAAALFVGRVGPAEPAYLLLVAVGIGVPSAYDEFGAGVVPERLAVPVTAAAAVLVTVEFVAVYLAAVARPGLSPTFAGTTAFVVVAFGNLAVLAVRDRRPEQA